MSDLIGLSLPQQFLAPVRQGLLGTGIEEQRIISHVVGTRGDFSRFSQGQSLQNFQGLIVGPLIQATSSDNTSLEVAIEQINRRSDSGIVILSTEERFAVLIRQFKRLQHVNVINQAEFDTAAQILLGLIS